MYGPIISNTTIIMTCNQLSPTPPFPVMDAATLIFIIAISPMAILAPKYIMKFPANPTKFSAHATLKLTNVNINIIGIVCRPCCSQCIPCSSTDKKYSSINPSSTPNMSGGSIMNSAMNFFAPLRYLNVLIFFALFTSLLVI